MSVMTIRDVLNHFLAGPPEMVDAIEEALVEREEAIAGLVRLAGDQFGAHPQIVAEVVCSIGLGRPVEPEVRQMIRRNFVAHMEELREQFRRQQDEN